MKFEECLKKRLVIKKSEDKAIVKGLLEMVNVRFKEVGNIENTTLKVEAYYEIIKELVTALLSDAGYKSFSNECLISFVKESYDNFTDS